MKLNDLINFVIMIEYKDMIMIIITMRMIPSQYQDLFLLLRTKITDKRKEKRKKKNYRHIRTL